MNLNGTWSVLDLTLVVAWLLTSWCHECQERAVLDSVPWSREPFSFGYVLRDARGLAYPDISLDQLHQVTELHQVTGVGAKFELVLGCKLACHQALLPRHCAEKVHVRIFVESRTSLDSFFV